jgi:hypothetical protein
MSVDVVALKILRCFFLIFSLSLSKLVIVFIFRSVRSVERDVQIDDVSISLCRPVGKKLEMTSHRSSSVQNGVRNEAIISLTMNFEVSSPGE